MDDQDRTAEEVSLEVADDQPAAELQAPEPAVESSVDPGPEVPADPASEPALKVRLYRLRPPGLPPRGVLRPSLRRPVLRNDCPPSMRGHDPGPKPRTRLR